MFDFEMIVRALLRAIAAVMLLAVSQSFAGQNVYTLQDAYTAALARNEVVKIAEENVVQSEARVDQAFTYIYPRIIGQAGYTRFNEVLPPDSAFVFQPIEEVRAGLILSQPLYTGGRTLAAYRMAKNMREASRHGLLSTRQDTMMAVAEAYYGVLKAQRIVDVSRDSYERMLRHKKVTEREAATRRSKANISALLRANTLVSQAGIVLTRAEDALRVARRRLSFLTNLPEDAVLSEPAPLSLPNEDMRQLIDTAVSQREDYKAARMNTMIAEENIAIVKGAHYPQLSLEGALQYKDSDPKTMTDGTIYYGGIRLSVPIFEGGLMKAEVAEARSKLRQAELSGILLRRSIETEVYEARVNLDTVTSVLRASKLQYNDAMRNFQTVESLFTEGLATSLSLIDAQQALFAAEREYVNAVYDQQLAILRLKKAIGLIGENLDPALAAAD